MSMDETPEDNRSAIADSSRKLAEMGRELSSMQFNYKVLDGKKPEYWEKRVEAFREHHAKSTEYYSQAHRLMSHVDKDGAGVFLLGIGKLRQTGRKLEELLEHIRQNPTIMSSKDKQQSKWSKETREQVIEYSDKTLEQEKALSKSFREFYEKYMTKNVSDA